MLWNRNHRKEGFTENLYFWAAQFFALYRKYQFRRSDLTIRNKSNSLRSPHPLYVTLDAAELFKSISAAPKIKLRDYPELAEGECFWWWNGASSSIIPDYSCFEQNIRIKNYLFSPLVCCLYLLYRTYSTQSLTSESRINAWKNKSTQWTEREIHMNLIMNFL